jgi:hypothetical protein
MQTETENADLVWGAEAIGQEINRNRRQTFYLLESGAIPAQKVGKIWVASRIKLRTHLVGEDA